MSTEQNKAITRTWLLEGFNNCDLSKVEECLTEDYINHGTTEVRGYEGGRQVLTQAQAWAPDGKIVIHSMVAEGDTVMVLFTFEGTHTGSVGGGPHRQAVQLPHDGCLSLSGW
jgi:predicted ester cyclase